jgi:hypothetical protein
MIIPSLSDGQVDNQKMMLGVKKSLHLLPNYGRFSAVY